MADSTDDGTKEPSVLRQELQNAKSTLKQPLTGKAVMVPITTKAFFAGTLKPNLKDTEEQVLVKMGGDNLVELDRSEAIAHLEGRIESLLPATTARIASDTVDGSQPISKEPSLPFFEIHEELDESGNEIKAEAINVAKQLEVLQKEDRKSGNGASFVPSASADEEVIEEEPETIRPVTESEYEALSSRLEMLARLEEEAEAAKVENQASAKKLQSKGWSKGFLNTKPKKKKSQLKKTPTSESAQSSNEGRKVAFQAQNEVREIPRVGERSASELKPSAPSSRKEIEPQVFSGVIRERSIGTTTSSSPSTKPPAKKKLSRFAQERQEQQR